MKRLCEDEKSWTGVGLKLKTFVFISATHRVRILRKVSRWVQPLNRPLHKHKCLCREMKTTFDEIVEVFLAYPAV
ncbi:hypothetical protein DPMN_029371 [Dreissena polymorpha]|uniref:Uncharacterized protein n=1 Tax=Dreissena polymorpha TaxID=45954 RepID=A0A9D4RF73_DREPO|nr:hypothetical protein DPMN_029371 [Dreissena polymorpha]